MSHETKPLTPRTQLTPAAKAAKLAAEQADHDRKQKEADAHDAMIAEHFKNHCIVVETDPRQKPRVAF
jgi:hypothetical protein